MLTDQAGKKYIPYAYKPMVASLLPSVLLKKQNLSPVDGLENFIKVTELP